MALEIVSRFGNDAYADKTLLVPEVSVTRTPARGSVLYDDASQSRPIRDYRRSSRATSPIRR